jgi:hypothetical protein
MTLGILSPPVLPDGFARLTQHSRSASSANSSTGLSNFTALGFGLPSARSLPTAIKT